MQQYASKKWTHGPTNLGNNGIQWEGAITAEDLNRDTVNGLAQQSKEQGRLVEDISAFLVRNFLFRNINQLNLWNNADLQY